MSGWEAIRLPRQIERREPTISELHDLFVELWDRLRECSVRAHIVSTSIPDMPDHVRSTLESIRLLTDRDRLYGKIQRLFTPLVGDEVLQGRSAYAALSVKYQAAMIELERLRKAAHHTQGQHEAGEQ